MPFDWLVLALLAVLLVLTLWIALRPLPIDTSLERQGRELRDEVMRSAQGTRQELAQSLALFQQTLLAQHGDIARTQNEQIDSFSRQLAAMQQRLVESLVQATAAHVEQARLARDSLDQRMGEVKTTVEAKETASTSGVIAPASRPTLARVLAAAR